MSFDSVGNAQPTVQPGMLWNNPQGFLNTLRAQGNSGQKLGNGAAQQMPQTQQMAAPPTASGATGQKQGNAQPAPMQMQTPTLNATLQRPISQGPQSPMPTPNSISTILGGNLFR